MKRIAILGSTGSIGRSTLSVIESNPDRFQLVALAAGSNTGAALEQARRWKPKVLSLASEQDANKVGRQLKIEGLGHIELAYGQAYFFAGPHRLICSFQTGNPYNCAHHKIHFAVSGH